MKIRGMTIRSGVRIGLMVLVGLSGRAGLADAATAACDRACLEGFAEKYLAAMLTHDPKKAPIAKVEDLYRDEIHVTNEAGKYLMHNAMRRALGQPASVAGFEKIDPEVKQYLDRVLTRLLRRT